MFEVQAPVSLVFYQRSIGIYQQPLLAHFTRALGLKFLVTAVTDCNRFAARVKSTGSMHGLHRRDLNDSFSYNRQLVDFKTQLVEDVRTARNEEAVFSYPSLSPRVKVTSPRAASAARLQADRVVSMQSTFVEAAAQNPALDGRFSAKRLPFVYTKPKPESPSRFLHSSSKQSVHSRRGRPLTGKTRKPVTSGEQYSPVARQHPLDNWEEQSSNNQDYSVASGNVASAANIVAHIETENQNIIRNLDLSGEPHLLFELLQKHSKLITRSMLDQIAVDTDSTEFAPGHALSQSMKEQLCNAVVTAKTRHNASNRRFKLLLAERESDILTKEEQIQKLVCQLEKRSTDLKMAKIAIHHLQHRLNMDESGDDEQ